MLTWLVLTFVATGLVFVGTSIPLIQRRIKPNYWYGFRVPKTLNNPDIWYDVNAYSGRWLLIMGIATVVVSVVLPLIPGMGLDTYALVTTTVISVLAIVMVVKSFLYLRKL
jgi:hypothetical protein